MSETAESAVVSSARSAISTFNSVLKKFTNTANDVKTAAKACHSSLLKIIEDLAREVEECHQNSGQHVVDDTKQRLDSIENAIKQLSNDFAAKQGKTYASALNTTTTPSRSETRSRPKPSNVVIVKSNDKKLNSKECEKRVKTALKRQNVDPIVTNVRHSGQGGLVLTCDTTEDVEQIIDIVGKTADLSAHKPKRRNPRIAIYGVPQDISEEDIITELVAKNRNIREIIDSTGTTVEDNITYKFALKRRDNPNTCTHVLELSPKVYKIVSNKPRLGLGWEQHRWADYIRITRCYQCQRYGHIAKDCTETDQTCGKCSEKHSTSDCNNSNKQCANCLRYNLKQKSSKTKCRADHTVEDRDCNSYINAKSNAISRICYE